MIFKIFSPKNSAKKLACLTRNKGKLCKILIKTMVFEKKLPIFTPKIGENRKKNFTITSTPGTDVMIFIISRPAYSLDSSGLGRCK
jgi:hypothetical protein